MLKNNGRLQGPTLPRTKRPWRSETLALWASLFFTLACNQSFWRALAAPPSEASAGGLSLLFFTALLVTGLQWLLLLLLVNRWTVKPLLILLFWLTAPAVYFMTKYGIYLDRSMLRNILETDVREAAELLNWQMLPYVLGLAVIPTVLLSRVTVARPPLRQALPVRAAAIAVALVMAAAGVWPVMSQLVPAMREQKQLRYLITPSNYVISLARSLPFARPAMAASDTPRSILADDLTRHPSPGKPVALVLVVGETVRADHWGLNGYQRQTTPELAAREVVNFSKVTSCGTDTATSLPCMFSVYGRRAYDEHRIRSTESVLQALDRLGVTVEWRDNQSGCKGVCSGLPFEDMSRATSPGLCKEGRCFDEILLQGLPQRLAAASGDVVLVLHMLGNHGPAYFQRYPDNFRRFTPTCDTTELAKCTPEELISTYDNGILYTDHVLASVIDLLSQEKTHDTGLLYVADHGESLGERNLYLHGMPYAIAPEAQTHVPMTMWLSPGLQARKALDMACLTRTATVPASHDVLFHTLLGMFDVQTRVYEADLDVLSGCGKGKMKI